MLGGRDAGDKRIVGVTFGVLSGATAMRHSVAAVTRFELFGGDGTSMPHGLYDAKMGVSRNETCAQCHEPYDVCGGHFGHIELAMPVYHAGYYKKLLVLLNLVCNQCLRLRLTDAQLAAFEMLMHKAGANALRRAAVAKSVMEQCRKARKCPRCQHEQRPIRRLKKASLALFLRAPPSDDSSVARREQSTNNSEHDDDDHDILAGAALQHTEDGADAALSEQDYVDVLSPLRVLSMLKAIPDCDCRVLNIELPDGRPEHWMMSIVPVPPLCVRPILGDKDQRSHDDLTVSLRHVVKRNAQLEQLLEQGENTAILMQTWDAVQTAYAAFMNSDLVTPDDASMSSITRGLVQRIKGKQGRFRQHLSGKRVNFSSRSVVSPDPNLRVDQVGVPVSAAMKLTYPERVTRHNIEQLRDAIRNGATRHPGAVRIIDFKTQQATSTAFGNLRAKAANLKLKDVVERHIRDGDVVLFNRQPSLHRMSIMCHRARILPYSTYRLNECVCGPYGADFDGDEMNLHVPQTEEARAEAAVLMAVSENMLTPKTGDPLVAAIQDFITISFLLTHKDFFFDRSQVCQLLDGFETDRHDLAPPNLPVPALLKPRRLWTGKQIFGVLLQPNPGQERLRIFLETMNKMYRKPLAGSEYDQMPWMDPGDAYVIVNDSELMCGRLDKKVLGSGSKSTLFFQIMAQHHSSAALARLCFLSRMCARVVGSLGFSIGIEDVTPPADLVAVKKHLIEDTMARCTGFIGQRRAESISADELEQNLQAHLSKLREEAGNACTQRMDPANAAVVMAHCGSKGSALNISQMAALVGQQILAGERISGGFSDRSLPHFEPHSEEPAARGFVQNSFHSGLKATEFFFHTMAGREGLIDTSVKTSETGYLQRKMIKVMEDLECMYDGTVRNAAGHLVQFCFGGDGLDPLKMEADGDDGVLHLEYLWRRVQSECLQQKEGALFLSSLDGEEVLRIRALIYGESQFSRKFAAQLVSFLLDESNDQSVAARLLRGALPDGRSTFPVTCAMIDRFVHLISRKYRAALIEAGSPVGALCSQSIGEPATQMTLKTFHFAGIGANITLGVPRLQELINGSVASTPLAMAPLQAAHLLDTVEAQLDPVFVSQVCHIQRSAEPTGWVYTLRLRRDVLEGLCLATVNAHHVRDALLNVPRAKVKASQVHVTKSDEVRIEMARADLKNQTLAEAMFSLQNKTLPKALVAGVRDVQGVTCETLEGRETVIVEGRVLASVIAAVGIDALRTYSNDVLEMASVLGIDAARDALVRELRYVMDQHHISLNSRHFELLADYMTWSGTVQGVNRFGMQRTQTSTLMKASFEQTADHLFEAAMQGARDPLRGVSEAIITGQLVPLGTGRSDAIKC